MKSPYADERAIFASAEREVALGLAIDHMKTQPNNGVAETIACAEEFLAFLKGGRTAEVASLGYKVTVVRSDDAGA